jgi:hypothetical protein
MTLDESIWDAAKFVCEWEADDLTYKLYEVPREASDSDETEPLHLLHGLDAGAVRRVDMTFDRTYDRLDREHRECAAEFVAASQTPEEARGIFALYTKPVAMA